MAESVIATKVYAAGDWQGIYVGDELRYENHSASVEDVTIRDTESLDDIEKESIDIRRLGRTSLPQSLTTLRQLASFADTVEENVEWWEEKIPSIMEKRDASYVMTDEAGEALGVTDKEGPVLLALFSKVDTMNTNTPLGRDPIVELDYDNCESGAGAAAYTLIESN